jgi:multiple sugar transport system substrate-binding protein
MKRFGRVGDRRMKREVCMMKLKNTGNMGRPRSRARHVAVFILVLMLVAAACGSGAGQSETTAPEGTAGEQSQDTAAGGTVRFASTWQGDTEALQVVVDKFEADSGITIEVNEVDGPTFSDQVNSYLQGTPDDMFTWFGGYRTRFYTEQGLLEPLNDVWDEIGGDYSEAYREVATGQDGNQYLIPFYAYPWVVLYRQSVFEEHGYEIPETMSDLTALAAQMEEDGLVPFAFADQDGWPAMGWFDILNMRLNGYQFHVDLLAGEESWTDERVTAVFDTWRELLPMYGDVSAALGRTWQDGANLLFNNEAGMLFFGTFAGTQADEETHADLGFFPFPTLGTEYDEEMAIDAPVNGFVVATGSPSLEENRSAVMAFAEYLGGGEAQTDFLAENPNFIAASDAADTSQYEPLQQQAADIIAQSGAIAQFLDRDTDPAFASEMEGILQDWLAAPDQDLEPFLQGIQDLWDSVVVR